VSTWRWGASVAVALRLGARWEFVPELSMIYSPTHFGGEVESSRQDGAVASQLTLGLSCRF
jgi:hypothetical protein